MHCIKTGFTLYAADINSWTRADLFFDGHNLYANHNTFIEGKPNNIEVECTSIEKNERYDLLVNPVVSQSVIEYVKDMKFKTYTEDSFIETFS